MWDGPRFRNGLTCEHVLEWWGARSGNAEKRISATSKGAPEEEFEPSPWDHLKGQVVWVRTVRDPSPGVLRGTSENKPG